MVAPYEPVAVPEPMPSPPPEAPLSDEPPAPGNGQNGDEPAGAADGGDQGEVKADVRATVEWEPQSFSLLQMLGTKPYGKGLGGGIYVIARTRGAPVYVGISDDLRTRWSSRLALFRELGVIGRLSQAPFSGFAVYIGRVQAQPSSSHLSRKDLLESVERVLVRYLIDVGKHPLTNSRGSARFTVGAGGINVVNRGTTLPPFLPSLILRRAGVAFEQGVQLAFEAEPFPAGSGSEQFIGDLFRRVFRRPTTPVPPPPPPPPPPATQRPESIYRRKAGDLAPDAPPSSMPAEPPPGPEAPWMATDRARARHDAARGVPERTIGGSRRRRL